MPNIRKRQRGAVAIIVGITIFVLIGMLALVVDLGHLYLAKTGLQNAADAGALSGAKELDGTAGGITLARDKAIETTGENTFFGGSGQEAVTIVQDDVEFSRTPDGPWVAYADALADPGDKTFIKVDTQLQSMSTWFAGIWEEADMQTFGLAVAGRYKIDITPLAVCQQPEIPGVDDELGFERGVAYELRTDANPIGPGTVYWIDPTSNTPGVCPTTNTNDARPYVCAGKVDFTPVIGGTVNTNTGVETALLNALDSRFGQYPVQAQCDPGTAPPDRNVRGYHCFNSGFDNGCLRDTNALNATGNGQPLDWMDPDPTARQSVLFDALGPKAYPRTFGEFGVLWSAFRPVGSNTGEWSARYGGNATNYPEPSPYAQTSAPFFQAPPAPYQNLGVPNRRVLNIVIVQCVNPGGVCRPAPVLGVGRFFMQREAVLPPGVQGNNGLFVEFGGLVPEPFTNSEIRLYH